MSRRNRRLALAWITPTALGLGLLVALRDEWLTKRVVIVEPGRLVRGAWQRPWPLSRLIEREQIKTIVTLTAINPDDPKYVVQKKVVDQTGVDWILIPMRGSRATLEQMAQAADLLADPDRQPLLFHCVAGHHRTSLAHAAYRIRHQGWSADQAWHELLALPWTQPEAASDQHDRRLIEAFAASPFAQPEELSHAIEPESASDSPAHAGRSDDRRAGADGRRVRRLADGDRQLRDDRAGPSLSLGPDERQSDRPRDPGPRD